MVSTARWFDLARLRFRVRLVLLLGWVLLAGCGFNVQTSKPYTPAEGVNFNVGTVMVRNLIVLSRVSGVESVLASMVSNQHDALVGVAGLPIMPDGSGGAPLQVQMPTPPSSRGSLSGAPI